MSLNHKGLKQKLLVVMAREWTPTNYSFRCCSLFLTSSILIDLSCSLMNSCGKDPDAGKDWRQKEKKVTEDEMVGWHHWFNGHELQKMVMDRRLCVLQSTGSERARHDFAAEWQLTCHLLHAANCVARALL